MHSKAYVRIRSEKDLRLIRMTGPGLAILGATAEVTPAGLPYDASQAWSKALAGHPVGADGIAYHGRHDDSQLCFGLFEAAESALPEADSRHTDL